MLEIVHAAGDVGLVVPEHFRRFGEAVVLGYKIKDPVVIVGDHRISSFLWVRSHNIKII